MDSLRILQTVFLGIIALSTSFLVVEAPVIACITTLNIFNGTPSGQPPYTNPCSPTGYNCYDVTLDGTTAKINSFILLSEQYPNDFSTPQMSSQRSEWRERLHANPSRMGHELAIKLEVDQIGYLTQVEITVTTADLYFPMEPRPLLVFVDGRVHLGTSQMVKDEELRTLLRKKRYRVLELFYDSYSDKKRDQLYEEIKNSLTKLAT